MGERQHHSLKSITDMQTETKNIPVDSVFCNYSTNLLVQAMLEESLIAL